MAGTDLVVIDKRLRETITFINTLFGDKLSPVPITDEKALNSAQENIVTLMDLKKAVEEYFKPKKQEARKPYDELLEQEKAWIKTIGDVREFVDAQIRDFNNRKRLEIQAREQAEAAERAAAERARLETLKAEAEAAGNTEMVQKVEQAVAATAEQVEVSEKKMVNRDSTSTMSETETIEDFQIVNHPQFAAALMETGNQGMIVLDKKTETAFKKYLIANKEIKAFPGVKFRRDFKTLYKPRKTAE